VNHASLPDLEPYLPRSLGVPGATLRRRDDLPDEPPAGFRRIGPRLWVGSEGDAWLRIEDAGRWHVQGGTTMDAAPESAALWSRVRCMSMATSLGILVLQRGDLPMHAACLLPPGADAAVLLCAASGTGKSTTTAVLARDGWGVLADDLTQVVDRDARSTALPGWSTVKLWPQSCVLLGLETSTMPEYPGLKDKRLWIPPVVVDRSAPIGAVVVLRRSAEFARGMAQPLGGAESLATLREQTFRPRLVAALRRESDHFQAVNTLARNARVFRLDAPSSWTPEQVAELVATTAG